MEGGRSHRGGPSHLEVCARHGTRIRDRSTYSVSTARASGVVVIGRRAVDARSAGAEWRHGSLYLQLLIWMHWLLSLRCRVRAEFPRGGALSRAVRPSAALATGSRIRGKESRSHW